MGAPAGAQALAKEAALTLLARSISFGHGRIAVIRLVIAVQAGAEVPPDHWLYCRAAAASCKDESLQRLLAEATNACTYSMDAGCQT